MACDCGVCTWQPPRGPARRLPALPSPGPPGPTPPPRCLNPPENDPPKALRKPAPPPADKSGLSPALTLLAVLVGLIAALLLAISAYAGDGSMPQQGYTTYQHPAPAPSYCAAPQPTCRQPVRRQSTCRQAPPAPRQCAPALPPPPPEPVCAPPPPPPVEEECVPEPEPEAADECEAEVAAEEEDECAGFEDEA